MADAKTLFTLLETAAGYALFEVIAFEEIGGSTEDVKDTVTDLKRFARAVKLKAFQPFESAHEALENANSISEHACSPTLHNFLELNLPKVKKKTTKTASFALGLVDPGLATAISEALGVSCRSDDTVKEISRGCRQHLDYFIKGLTGGAAERAQLGLGHSYSRSKVKFNPARSDNMIIQSIALLDQLDKDVNTFAMRVREWYSWHFPELKDIVKDNIMFARAAAYIQNKNSLLSSAGGKKKGEEEDDGDDDDDAMDTSGSDNKEDKMPGLIEIVGEEEMAKAIVSAARTSMGMDCSPVDMLNITNFTERMVKLAEYRRKLSQYLTDKMEVVAPNLSALIGDTVAARLISKAGSLTNLAKAPASTVQILGAEKALFRALKTKGNTPKYGLIYHSSFIGRAEAKNKGRISRYLANKCSIATRIDSFSDEPNRLYGEKLRDQVEERLKFYETGAKPRRNVDVMAEVAKELKGGDDAMDMDDSDDDDDEETPAKGKKDKKKRKKESTADEDDADEGDEEAVETPAKSKKEKKKEKKSSSKKRKAEEVDGDEATNEEDDKKALKKAKKEEKKKKKEKKKRKSKE